MSITHSYNSNVLSRSMMSNIIEAKTIKEAKNSMGIIDKIFDLFRGGVKRRVIEELFYAIHDKHATDQDRLSSFSALRELASSEHQNKFTIEIKQLPNSYFYYSLNIDGNNAYSRENVSNVRDQQDVLNAAITHQTNNLKDAFANNRADDILFLLKESTEEFDTEWYGSDSIRMSHLTISDKKTLFAQHQETAYDAQERSTFYEEKWQRICTNLDLSDKETIYSYITGEKGDRLRSVLGFLQDKVMEAEIDDQLVSLPTKLFSTLTKIAEVIGADLHPEVPQLNESATITSYEQLTPDETNALSRIGLSQLLEGYEVGNLLHLKPRSVVV